MAESGLMHHLGRVAYRKVPRVRIPLSPPLAIRKISVIIKHSFSFIAY
jgi:hypothetical protein